jgi:hypothetical protein
MATPIQDTPMVSETAMATSNSDKLLLLPHPQLLPMEATLEIMLQEMPMESERTTDRSTWSSVMSLEIKSTTMASKFPMDMETIMEMVLQESLMESEVAMEMDKSLLEVLEPPSETTLVTQTAMLLPVQETDQEMEMETSLLESPTREPNLTSEPKKLLARATIFLPSWGDIEDHRDSHVKYIFYTLLINIAN